MLQNITKYYKVLQSITKTNLAHRLGPIFGLVILLSGPLRRWFLLTVRTLTKSPTRYKSDIYNVVSQKKRSSLLPASHSSLPQRGFVRNHFYDGRNLYRKVVHGIFSALLVPLFNTKTTWCTLIYLSL